MSGGPRDGTPALDCATIREMGIADEYRAGRLTREDAEAFEEHYFGCADCFEDLQFGDHLAAYLRDEGKDVLPVERVDLLDRAEPAAPRPVMSVRPRPPRPVETDRPRPWWHRPAPGPAWAWGLALVVSTVLVVAIVATRAERDERLRGLIDPLPHPYLTVDLRSGPGGAGFEEAMRLYGSGSYAEAAAGLERILDSGPEDAEVAFYLGVSRLLTRQPPLARDALRRAVENDPESSLYRWYLAQSLAACGDLHGALTELERIIREGSPQATQAQGLRDQILELL